MRVELHGLVSKLHPPVVDEADVEGRAARFQARHQRILKVPQQPAAEKHGGVESQDRTGLGGGWAVSMERVA